MANIQIIWDLTDFYKGPEDQKVEKDIEDLLKKSQNFQEKVRGKIKTNKFTAEQLLNWYKEYEVISEEAFYLETYSQLLYSINTLEDSTKAFVAKIDDNNVKIQENLLFFNLELNEISEEKFAEIIDNPELEQYKHALLINRLRKPHQLTEKEEQIILMKNITGKNAFQKLYDELKSSFTFDFEVDGVKKQLTEAELFANMYRTDKDLRSKALKTIVAKYTENELVFTHIFNNILKDWDIETKKKKYKTPISQRNLMNEVSDEIVDTVGKVTTESYTIVEKYYLLKKKVLGLTELHMSDLYAPVGRITQEYTYKKALELIKSINHNFHPEFKEIIEKMDGMHHIDATPRKGKNRGAFCAFGKLKHYPFVFVNFVNNIDSVRTLAHELGHAIQAYYIQRDQNFINMDISLAIAEIASVFNEMLIIDHLMNSDLSKEEKVSLLCVFIEKNIATSFRQNAFYNFEKGIHALIESKLPTTKEIKDIFVQEMKSMFGESVRNIAEDYASYCFVVPHFLHDPFYVYAYNISNLLVISLYQMYLEEGKTFVPKFLKLLAIGSSHTPQEMLSDIGINLNDPSFWQKGIKFLADKVSELESLINSN
ncbi:MAG: M3 family oligoendopeptidase [Candidatus Thorarchaeota archaeon]